MGSSQRDGARTPKFRSCSVDAEWRPSAARDRRPQPREAATRSERLELVTARSMRRLERWLRAGAAVLGTCAVVLTGCGPVGTPDAADAGDAGDARAADAPSDSPSDAPGGFQTAYMSLEVLPRRATMTPGGTLHFTAITTRWNWTTADATAFVVWRSSNPSVVTIDASGSARALAEGDVMITATLEGYTSAPAQLSVSREPPRPLYLSCAPSTLSLLAGDTTSHQFTARALLSDHTSQVLSDHPQLLWGTSDHSVASIDHAGLMTTGAAGTALITARLGGVSSDPCVVTVREAPRSLALDPPMATLPIGATQRFTVTGTFADGRTADVTAAATLRSSDDAVAAFGAGTERLQLTCGRAGTATITATLGPLTATAIVTVYGS